MLQALAKFPFHQLLLMLRLERRVPPASPTSLKCLRLSRLSQSLFYPPRESHQHLSQHLSTRRVKCTQRSSQGRTRFLIMVRLLFVCFRSFDTKGRQTRRQRIDPRARVFCAYFYLCLMYVCKMSTTRSFVLSWPQVQVLFTRLCVESLLSLPRAQDASCRRES